jgi:hypothetical protein
MHIRTIIIAPLCLVSLAVISRGSCYAVQYISISLLHWLGSGTSFSYLLILCCVFQGRHFWYQVASPFTLVICWPILFQRYDLILTICLI